MTDKGSPKLTSADDNNVVFFIKVTHNSRFRREKNVPEMVFLVDRER